MMQSSVTRRKAEQKSDWSRFIGGEVLLSITKPCIRNTFRALAVPAECTAPFFATVPSASHPTRLIPG
jgi:hypothetical protein